MASEGDAESEYIPNPSFKLQHHWTKKSIQQRSSLMPKKFYTVWELREPYISFYGMFFHVGERDFGEGEDGVLL